MRNDPMSGNPRRPDDPSPPAGASGSGSVAAPVQVSGAGPAVAAPADALLGDLADAIAPLLRQFADVLDRVPVESHAGPAPGGDPAAAAVRGPLTVLLGTVGTALKGPLAPRQADAMRQLERAGRALLGLVDEVQDRGPVGPAAASPATATFPLEPWLAEVAERLGEATADAPVELLIAPAADLPPLLQGDRRRLLRLLCSLGRQAIRRTGRGEVVIDIGRVVPDASTDAAPATERLRVAIRGRSTAAAAEPSPADDGLERRIAALVAESGGTVERPGADGGLVVELPVGLPFDAAGEQASPDAGAAADTLPLRGRRLLLVDDHPATRDLWQRFAAGLGLEADAVADGWDALRAVAVAETARRPYDLVLIDGRMPGMTGIECVRQMARARHLHPPRLMLAGAQGRESALLELAAARLAVRVVVAKPLLPSTLAAACLAALSDAAPPGAAAAAMSAADTGRAAPAASAGPFPRPGSPRAAVAEGLSMRSPSPATASARAASDPLSGLPGVDIEVGRASTMGNDKLLRRLLDMYREGQSDFAGKFRSARRSGDNVAAGRLAHTLRSVSGSLGVRGVQRAADALERACDAHLDDHEIEVRIDAVVHELEPVLAGLGALPK